MEEFIDQLARLLPLDIVEVETDSLGLTISGSLWQLRINTNWRVVKGGHVVASRSISEGSNEGQRDYLSGDSFVKVDYQSSLTRIDPIFTLKSGGVLEIFSDYPYAEWSFSTWRASDPLRTPVLDYEGPIV